MAIRLNFPSDQTVYEAPNGVKYVLENGYWQQEFDGGDFFDDRYVKIPGDVMTGSLTSPSFTGNFGVEVLKELD